MAVARTVQQVVEGALRVLGVLASGEVSSADDTAIGLEVLQDLLAEWSDGGLVVPSVIQEAIPLVVGLVTYTVGENGAPSLVTVRPEQIIGAFVRDASNYDYDVTIIQEKAYRGLADKASVAGRPDQLWYNATAPNGTIKVWPAPSAIESLWISSMKPFTEPTALADDLLNVVQIPRNYHNALKWNLAVQLAPEYGKEPSEALVGLAKRGYDMIISLNAARRVQPASLEIPGMVSRRNDILIR